MLNEYLMNGIEHPVDGNVKVWRYMNLPKFLQLLQSSELFLVRSDKFGDPFEGTLSKSDIENMKNIYKSLGMKDSDVGMHLFEDEVEKANRERFRKETFISCWHINESESEAMWKIYGNHDESIAIQTTYKHLKECAATSEQYPNMMIGKVKYVSYDSQTVPTSGHPFLPFLNKRKAFAYEEEARIVIMQSQDLRNPIEFLTLSVDLHTLIHGIYVSPLAPKWFYQVVKDVCVKYEIDCNKVHRSNMLIDPLEGFEI